MKIKSLQISNILSFQYVNNIAEAEPIYFDDNFNILIGQNGSGKSTVLEIINLIFQRVLFIPYNRNQDLYNQRSTINTDQKKQILASMGGNQSYGNLRLERNYDFEDKTQKIRVVVRLDDIDKANIQHLRTNKANLSSTVGAYSAQQMFGDGEYQDEYQIDIELNSSNKTFIVSVQEDVGLTYLKAHNLYKHVIEIFNEENPDQAISNLTESFAMIGGYRNYSSYTPHASLGGGNTALKQIQQIRVTEFNKSTNATEGGEPSIFSLVRLRMADACYSLISTNKSREECEVAANEIDFIARINEKLKIVNLKVEIKLIDISSWNFSFSFIDTKRSRVISDINSLSAGQKAIIHLVFEAYGRGDIKGGLVIIDEPEIHLHYQYQNEYLRVIEKLNNEQKCQYILVTHSESLINSETISSVIRLSLDDQDYTKINKPILTTDQKWLVKILDNTRSTHAFFGSKILLVEGETDRYFFRASLGEIEKKIKKGVAQEVTVLDIGGKSNLAIWKDLFEAFGLKVFSIRDFDAAYEFYPTEQRARIKTVQAVSQFIANHQDVVTRIKAEYVSGNFILLEGDLEIYLNLPNKGLNYVIQFCNTSLGSYLANTANDTNVNEIKKHLETIIGEPIGL